MSQYGESSRRPVVLCDPTKGAKQSFKDECDINNILKRHKAGGIVTHVNANAGRFADVSEVGDYRTAMDRVADARGFFSQLSSEIRREFDNDAAVFLDFILDPANEDRISELGLTEVTQSVETVGVPQEGPELEPEGSE